MKRRVFLLHRVAIATACSFLVVKSTHAQQMLFPAENWPTSTSDAVLVDSAKLEEAVSYLESIAPSNGPGIDQMIIVKNGRMIWRGPDIDNAHHVWSVSKSFASTALGLLADDGLVTVDTLAADYVPSMAADYQDVTLGHLVTNTSGYFAQGETGYSVTGPRDPSIPGPPRFTPPGSAFAYSTTGFDQLTNALTRVAGDSLQEVFQRRIGDPIGMAAESWDWTEYEAADGTMIDAGGGYLGRGINISAVNLARVGQLFLNNGAWDGQQLISREWIEEATSVRVPRTVPLHPSSGTSGPGRYGFGWWIGPDRFEAAGYENNFLTVLTDADLVVARLGGSRSNLQWSTFISRLHSATRTEAIWDRLGDGTWEDIDPQTGKSRWFGEGTDELVIYPDNHPGSVIIDSDTVTATLDHRVGSLTLDGGRLNLDDSTLTVDNTLTVMPGAILSIDGIGSQLEIGRALDIAGDASIELVIDDGRSSPMLLFAGRNRPRLAGILDVSLSADADREQLVGQTINLFDWSNPPAPDDVFGSIEVPPHTEWDFSQLYTTGDVILSAITMPSLQAGDADQDLDFDQFDLVKVQIGAKYLTGEQATWGEGDWNGAPGGFPGSPPEGDGVFNQLDIVAAQQAGLYLTGSYAADTLVAVPEPCAILLIIVGWMLLPYRLMSRARRIHP